MATQTREIAGWAPGGSCSTTYDDVTGIVSAVHWQNATAYPATITFTAAGVSKAFTIPVGASGDLNVSAANASLTKQTVSGKSVWGFPVALTVGVSWGPVGVHA